MPSERKKYVLEAVLPKTVESGRFGKGLKFVRCDTNEGKTGDQYASSVVFLSAILTSDTDGTGTEQSFKIVLKFMPDNAKMCEVMNSAAQFHNENVMYKEILPFLNFNDITASLFPEFYYGNTVKNEGQEPIVVIEDLSDKNFGLCKHRLFLDYDHVILALKALGQFHGLSYVAKQKDPIGFHKITNRLIEHAWNRDDGGMSVGTIIGPSSLRGVKAFREIQHSEQLEKLSKRLETDSVGLMKSFIAPDEPSAVICHGDFCNHNLLFSYDNPDQTTPTSVRMIDLQTSRYASPVIDLSMILFLNTEYELRSRHWDDFLSAYHDSVTETVTAAGCTPLHFDILVNDLKQKGFYGYFHCSYFLPMMVNQVRPDLDQAVAGSDQELMKQMLEMGGERATQLLISLLKHMQELEWFSFL